MKQSGSLVCVGTGMTLGAHISPVCRSHIEAADVVFVSVSDALTEQWVSGMNKDVRSLQDLYAEGKSRHQTYREMIDLMMQEVRRGHRVCGAFYGHPGVFAYAPHRVIEVARDEGYQAHMEPGISAEDCLYADLGLDPGRTGCIHYEASQYLLYDRMIDPTALVVLWQIGVVGDRSVSQLVTGMNQRALLAEQLMSVYPSEHEIILYECATLPISRPRMDRIALERFSESEISAETTMVIPALHSPQLNQKVADKFAELAELHTE